MIQDRAVLDITISLQSLSQNLISI